MYIIKALIILIITSVISSELHHGPAHPIKQILKSQLDSTAEEAFKVWLFLHKRDYNVNSEEGKTRFENFKKNFHIIKKHNSKTQNSYSLGLNNFADLTVGEFHKKYLFSNKVFFHQNLKSDSNSAEKDNSEGKLQNKQMQMQKQKQKEDENTLIIKSKKELYSLFWNTPDAEDESFINPTKETIKINNEKTLRFLESSSISTSFKNKINNTKNKFTEFKAVNWILKGSMNQYVEQQGECGSCWAFSAAQAVQAAYSIKTGVSERFSKQQLVDCDEHSDACNGGFPHYAMEYIKKTGLVPEKEYPYKIDMTEEYKKNCVFEKLEAEKKEKVVKIKDYEYCVDKDECKTDEGLFDMLSRGPLSAVVDASEEFMLYENGVFDKPCSEMNHAILVAGYHKAEKEGEDSYWIVKNSWGHFWGDHGYIKIKQAKDYTSCMLNQYYLRPILE